MSRYVHLRLTRLEAINLRLVAGNGWGNGDFAGYLNNPKDARACQRAIAKLITAIYPQPKGTMQRAKHGKGGKVPR